MKREDLLEPWNSGIVGMFGLKITAGQTNDKNLGRPHWWVGWNVERENFSGMSGMEGKVLHGAPEGQPKYDHHCLEMPYI